jgi:hypothetical protein
MSQQSLEVTCPCCSKRLVVDLSTGKAERAEAAASPADSRDPWTSAQDKVRGRTLSGTEKLENALREERGKSSKLDQLFKDAQDKLRRSDE